MLLRAMLTELKDVIFIELFLGQLPCIPNPFTQWTGPLLTGQPWQSH